MAMRMRRDRTKEARWCGHLRAQRRSGLSVRGYCREHGLSEPVFYHWKREVARREAERRSGRRDRKQAAVAYAGPATESQASSSLSEACFAEIEVTDDDSARPHPAEPSNSRTIEVCLAGGRTTLLRAGFDAAMFLRVVALLEGRPSC